MATCGGPAKRYTSPVERQTNHRNWPIGLSYDLLTGLDPTQREDSESPVWTLVLHSKNYPSEYVLRLDSEQTLADLWLQQTKESCFVRDGNANAIMGLSTESTAELWNAVRTHSFQQFWAIADRFLGPSLTSLKSVPIKVYLPVSNRVLQAVVPPSTDGQAQTVGTALHTHMPDLFPSRRTCVLARPLLHGVVLPMQAPLAQLLPVAMYLDGFLHITILMMA